MIKEKNRLYRQFEHGKILIDIADSVFSCLQPERLMADQISHQGQYLIVQGKKFNLKKFQHVYVVGAGKATYGMAKSLSKILGSKITAGYLNVPVAYTKSIGKIKVNQAGHPYPDNAGFKGSKEILKIVKSAQPDDLVICLISGGGSAMLPLPVAGLTLQEKVSITERLMKKSADIIELNAVRKHLSAIKGGQLAEAAAPATVVSLIISDVLGDKLDVIASGPTVADSSTSKEALEVLHRYKVGSQKIKKLIQDNETLKQLSETRVHNFIVGNNQRALEEVEKHAKKAGLNTMVLTSSIKGEAKEVAQVLTAIAQEINDYNRPLKTPALLIAGGETTVTVLGNGQGGRNQELVLAAVPLMNSEMSIISLATDGVDGITPEPVAGAIADGGVAQQCVIEDVNYHDYLYSNDSFNCLKKLGCLLHTGPTGTNVGDVILVLIT
ncbi:MAG: glycerate kinase [bacterium]|nr:glycerate kinase [bacterium]